MDYSRSQTPVLPKNVEDGVNKFRVGEDFALAHRLQGKMAAGVIRENLTFWPQISRIIKILFLEREYENHQRFNHEQRHVVQSDIRLAKRAQSLEEERARARGILTEAEKRQVEYRDRQIAEQYQQENIERYLDYYHL